MNHEDSKKSKTKKDETVILSFLLCAFVVFSSSARVRARLRGTLTHFHYVTFSEWDKPFPVRAHAHAHCSRW